MAKPAKEEGGYVYVVRIGKLELVAESARVATGDADWEAIKDDLCVIKVGKSNLHRLSARINEQANGWGKLLGVAGRDGIFPTLDISVNKPQVSICKDTNSADDMATAAVEKRNAMRDAMRTGKVPICADIGCWVQRGEEHDIDTDEKFVRSLLGLPLRKKLLEQLVHTFNRNCFKYCSTGDRKSEVASGVDSLASTEYIITTNAHFNRLRSAFLGPGEFKLADLVNALTPDGLVLRTFANVTVTLDAPLFPKQFGAPHVLQVPVVRCVQTHAATAAAAAAEVDELGTVLQKTLKVNEI